MFLSEAGYATSHVEQAYRYTWRADDGNLRNEELPIAAFGDWPHSFRTACVTAFSADSEASLCESFERVRFLAAPVAIIQRERGTQIQFWSVRRDTRPEMLLEGLTQNWPGDLGPRAREFAPSRIMPAKRGHAQLSFVDSGLLEWVERITGQALTTLLESLVSDAFGQVSRAQAAKAQTRQDLLRLVFQLFACRVLEDKGAIAASGSPRRTLQEAHRKFSENIDPRALDSDAFPDTLPDYVFSALQNRFAFASITTDMLGQAYENALVTPTLRKHLGIYYTPRVVTDYILSRLPIEALRQEDRYLLDPCCGSGSFLLAGFDRLSNALDGAWSSAQRHHYLRTRISGSDKDPFAVELATLSLLINDADNRNGWKVRQKDVLDLTTDTPDRRPTIIVTNPPFKEIKEAGTRRELAADILMKLVELTAANGFLGVVLPQSFLDSRAAVEARRMVLSKCYLLEIATLPGGVFYSDAETAVFVLQKRAKNSTPLSSSVATVSELRSRDLPEFERFRRFSTAYTADPEQWKSDPNATFVLSPVPEVWARLERNLPALREVATINTGIQVKASDLSSVSPTKRPGDVKYVDRLQEVLRPFLLLTTANLRPYKWLQYGDQLHRKRDSEIFEPSKVLINSNRNPGTSWRLVAAMAPAKVYFSLNFHGIRPIGTNASLEQITAVLNSPVANAWFDCHCRRRWVVVEILERLPFPQFDTVSARKVDDLVRRIERALAVKLGRKQEGMFYEGLFEDADASLLLRELDELVYDGYGLSSDERRNISRFMASDKRPGL
jgi:hypothetical protein